MQSPWTEVERELNRRMFECELHNLMESVELIFEAADREISNNFTEVYLITRMKRSFSAQLLFSMGSRIFPRLGKYLDNIIVSYPMQMAFWSMMINVISTEEDIPDKPLVLSPITEWVQWLKAKYPQ